MNKLSPLLKKKKHNRQLGSKKLTPILLREVISRITGIYSCNEINSCFLVLFAYRIPFYLILTVLLWFYNAPSTRKLFHLWFAIFRTIISSDHEWIETTCHLSSKAAKFYILYLCFHQVCPATSSYAGENYHTGKIWPPYRHRGASGLSILKRQKGL